MHTSLPEGIVWLMIILPLCGTEIVFSKPEHFIQTYWGFFAARYRECKLIMSFLMSCVSSFRKKIRLFYCCVQATTFTHIFHLLCFPFLQAVCESVFHRNFLSSIGFSAKTVMCIFFILPHMAFK